VQVSIDERHAFTQTLYVAGIAGREGFLCEKVGQLEIVHHLQCDIGSLKVDGGEPRNRQLHAVYAHHLMREQSRHHDHQDAVT
jgi:hypothetical protein